MFNPYFHESGGILECSSGRKNENPVDMILQKFKRLDNDDLLILMLIFLLFRDGKRESIWPLLAALVYCMLS